MAIRYSTIILTLLLTVPAFAQTGPNYKAIKQFPLDDRSVYQIKVGKNQATTIMFPSSISALESANVTSDPKVPGAVLLSYAKGRYFFSLRALQEDVSANLNVVWNRKTYVLEIQSDEQPFNSVTFYQPAEPGTTSSKDSLGPIRLLGLLDKAKAYHLIQSQYPEAIPQVDTAQPHNRIAYQDFEVEVAEVFRFDPEDTLVFKILLYNHSQSEIYYQPQSLAIRVGLDVFYSALSDASGIMPPANFNPETKKVEPSISLAYFVVRGTPNGGRNNLAVTNAFNVIVNRQVPLIPKATGQLDPKTIIKPGNTQSDR
jgi:hypothetical protein